MSRSNPPNNREPRARAARRDGAVGAGPGVVIIGAPPSLAGQDATAPVHLDLHEITADELARHRADLVLSPLVAEHFDCFDVAQALVEAGFCGRYRAVVQQVPDPALVRCEVAANCPGLDFDIVFLDPPGAPEG